MYYGIYTAAAGANAQSQQLEVISHNLANVGTTGFKRELGLLQARASEAQERGLDSPASRNINEIGGGVQMVSSSTDFTEGPIRFTGTDTDFALEQPDTFFVVEKDDQELLTRAGNFHLNSTGGLVTDQGYPVLGADGAPIQLDASLPFTVSNQGVIEQAGEVRPLGIKRPASLGDLVRVGENLFSVIGDEAQNVPDEERAVQWRHLEMSAVQPQAEMVRMIATSRAYEANIRMIQNQDSVLGSLISRMLRS